MAPSIVLFTNGEKPSAVRLADAIRRFVKPRGWKVYDAQELAPPLPQVDLIVTLGGDGTVLRYVGAPIYQAGVPVLPVHLGTLGYIAETTVDSWQEVLEGFFWGKASISRRTLLEVRHYSRGNYLKDYRGLNELVVCGVSAARLVWIDLYLSNFRFPLRADGLIIATPTGSTAYSVAAGGPIVYPELEALTFTPICPFSLSTRPIVFPPSESVRVVIGKNYRQGKGIATVDGRDQFELQRGDVIEIYRDIEPLPIVVPHGRSFFPVISDKLGWRGG